MNTCNYQPADRNYAPCTRQAGHDGPCAHPFVKRLLLEALHDRTPIDEAWLRSKGWREWEPSDDEDVPREFDLWIPLANEIGWECRLAWASNGLYAVRMADPKTFHGLAESVELLGTRNTIRPVTLGQLRALLFALTPAIITVTTDANSDAAP